MNIFLTGINKSTNIFNVHSYFHNENISREGNSFSIFYRNCNLTNIKKTKFNEDIVVIFRPMMHNEEITAHHFQ